MNKVQKKAKVGQHQKDSKKVNPSVPVKHLYRDNLKISLVVESYTRSEKNPVQINSADRKTETCSVTFPSLSMIDFENEIRDALIMNGTDLNGNESFHSVLQKYMALLSLSLGKMSVENRQLPGQLLNPAVLPSIESETAPSLPET